jgi:hypothetical protein
MLNGGSASLLKSAFVTRYSLAASNRRRRQSGTRNNRYEPDPKPVRPFHLFDPNKLQSRRLAGLFFIGWACPVLNSASRNSRDTFHQRCRREATSLTWPATERGIMNFKLTSWLLSFALAVLMFGIVSIALFDRMHASL